MINRKGMEIHERAVRRGKQYLRCEAELIESLQEVEAHRIYLEYECPSLHAYAVKYIGLTDSIASSFITVARKAREVPALKEAIVAGLLQVQKARKITPVLNNENQSSWISLAITSSQKIIEKEVAKILPETEKPEKAKFISGTRVNLNVYFSDEHFELLKRAQDLESQRSRKAAKFEDAIVEALKVYIQKLDPLEKAKRWEAKKQKDGINGENRIQN